MAFLYSDLNSINPTAQPLLYDVQDINQALFNLFNTSPGERPFLPTYGIDLDDELFELITEDTAAEIYRLVVGAVARWETRVVIDNSRTEVIAKPTENAYELQLFFSIPSMNGQQFVFTGTFTQ